uniref:Splicing factor U2AF subunit n=1 Tax=Anthurium amnicola TaxID=1678845 RepID=A0A1D1YVB3_9ARAE
MSIIHGQKEKNGNGNSHLGNDSSEGTSARTRAFSFEQIMSRRRKKKLVEDAKEEALHPMVISEKGVSEYGPGHTGPDGGNNLRKAKDTTGSSKTMDKVIHTKKTSPRKHKDKISHDLEANMKVKATHDMRSRDKEFKKEGHRHHRSRTDDRSKAESGKQPSKKPSKDAQRKDKHEFEDGKSLRECKMKDLTGSDEKSRREMDGFTPKKRDSGKRKDIEPLERRKNQRYEEPRLKRRRSKSWEYDRGRDRGSVSVSPRVHKRSFHGRDHGESFSRSLKERPRRKYSDAEKYRTSGNGDYESGHYRRRGSGLGGYSPRKRRTEAAASKIPSPTTSSPERKGATWDLPPSGVTHATSGQMPGSLQSSTQNVQDQPPSILDTPTIVKSQWTPSSSAAPAISFASIDSVHLTQATRPMRRLYIENLPVSATDKSIIGCLNDFLLSTGTNHIQGTRPCISCIINEEKCQAVVEFITPEDATAALSFDGKSFSGSILKLRRPKDFIDATPTTGAPEKPAALVNAIADVVKDSPHKIFIGGISEFLSSDMLLEIVGVFGLVKAYHFEFNLDFNQPCAFLEYVDQSITQKACAGLNGMKLGGNVLTVVTALPDALLGEENAEKPPSYGIPEHVRPLLENPTLVLELKNVLSEPELEEILEDIRLECARFGTVKSVNVVRDMNIDNATTKVEQDLIVGTGKMETREEIFGCDTNQNNEVPLDDVKKSQDIGETLRNMGTLVDNVDNDCENKVTDHSSQTTTDVTWEVPAKTEVAVGEPSSDNEVKLEGGHGIEDGLVKGESSKGPVNTELGKTLIDVDTTLPEKSDGIPEDGDHQAADYMFEPGCVLVEFLREEATCMASHCLNGRLYDGRVVATLYAAHDVYLAHFPR